MKLETWWFNKTHSELETDGKFNNSGLHVIGTCSQGCKNWIPSMVWPVSRAEGCAINENDKNDPDFGCVDWEKKGGTDGGV